MYTFTYVTIGIASKNPQKPRKIRRGHHHHCIYTYIYIIYIWYIYIFIYISIGIASKNPQKPRKIRRGSKDKLQKNSSFTGSVDSQGSSVDTREGIHRYMCIYEYICVHMKIYSNLNIEMLTYIHKYRYNIYGFTFENS
jgi:hypothetical protein